MLHIKFGIQTLHYAEGGKMASRFSCCNTCIVKCVTKFNDERSTTWVYSFVQVRLHSAALPWQACVDIVENVLGWDIQNLAILWPAVHVYRLGGPRVQTYDHTIIYRTPVLMCIFLPILQVWKDSECQDPAAGQGQWRHHCRHRGVHGHPIGVQGPQL